VSFKDPRHQPQAFCHSDVREQEQARVSFLGGENQGTEMLVEGHEDTPLDCGKPE